MARVCLDLPDYGDRRHVAAGIYDHVAGDAHLYAWFWFGCGLGRAPGLLEDYHMGMMDGWMDGWIEFGV